MKKLTLFFIFTLALTFALTVNAQNTKKAAAKDNKKIEAYYFHFTSRCVTCKTVEAKAKEDLEVLYPELVKEGRITFKSLNLDEAAGKALAEKLEVSGQTLLLVSGNEKINLTNEGFMYAKTNPEKFKSIIKEKVDKLLN